MKVVFWWIQLIASFAVLNCFGYFCNQKYQTNQDIKNILSEKFHYQCRNSTRHKCSPENISNRDKPWPVFHKDMVCEIIRAIGEESEYRTTESYFSEWSIPSYSRYDNEIQHTKNIDSIEEKRRRNSHFTRGEMWEILCVPFGTKERNPDSIDGEKEHKCRNENEDKFHHKRRLKKTATHISIAAITDCITKNY